MVWFFFCLVAIDPKVRASVCIGWPGQFSLVPPNSRPDPAFKFFGLGSLVWAVLLITLSIYSEKYCTFRPHSWISIEAIPAFLAVFVSSKILIGPALEVQKSIRLVAQNKFDRPISFQLYDAMVLYPRNLYLGLVWKSVQVGVFAVLLAVASLVGLTGAIDDSIVPLPLFLAWVLASMARVAGLIIHLPVRHRFQVALYAATIIACFVVWLHVEAMLKGCGAIVGELPGWRTVIVGVLGLPLFDFILMSMVAGSAVLSAWLLSRLR